MTEVTAETEKPAALTKKTALIIMVAAFFVFLTTICFIEQAQISQKPLENEKAVQIPIPEKPDFSTIKDIKQKKSAFFTYINTLVKQANQAVLKERQILLTMDKALKQDATLSNTNLLELCEKYKATCNPQSSKASIKTLLYHIDIVPPSLAMAQAANESAWGTSRFATEANNYFGQWCYKKGCGLVPKLRSVGTAHEVRYFASVYDSVAGYIYNLNTAKAYKKLRKIRHDLRTDGKDPSGLLLAQGLISYSERGEAYVKEIQALIRHNKLQQYDSEPYRL